MKTLKAMTALALLAMMTLTVHAASINAGSCKRAADKISNKLIESYNRETKTFGAAAEKDDMLQTAAMCAALLTHPRDYKESNGPFISAPMKLLDSKTGADGAIEGMKKPEERYLAFLTFLYCANDKHKRAFDSIKNGGIFENPVKLKPAKAAEMPEIKADRNTLLAAALALENLHAGGIKEIDDGNGAKVKWGEIAAGAVLKLQREDGLVSDDIAVNGLAVLILNLSWNALK